MQIVVERITAPRPLQRPSDVERHPIDFGIEPAPPAPAKPEATIVKSAISKDPDPIPESIENVRDVQPSTPKDVVHTQTSTPKVEDPGKAEAPVEDDWGEGIL